LQAYYQGVFGVKINTKSESNIALTENSKADSTTGLFVDIDQVISYASTLYSEELPKDVISKVSAYTKMIDAHAAEAEGGLNVFMYHVEMPKGASRIDYVDIKADLAGYNYELVVKTFLSAVKRWRRDANVYLVTNKNSSWFKFSSKQVHVMGLDVDAETPMFERVHAMLAYVQSKAFSADTIFLDSDAFLNSDCSELFDSEFDVAITTRKLGGVMPVNEGVIFAKVENKPVVLDFFRSYLATYYQLISDNHIRDFYGDIQKWRGGQLSLNAVCFTLSPYSHYRPMKIGGCSVISLPCDVYNYSWNLGEDQQIGELKRKAVIHIKGNRKSAVEQVADLLATFRPDGPDHYVSPYFALFNKEYNVHPLNVEANKKRFVENIVGSAQFLNANTSGSSALLADDMFVWFRTLGFLRESDFIRAMDRYKDNAILKARIWRVYLMCWAARSCLKVEGDFVDVGCYDGLTMDVVTRYIDFKQVNKQYYMFDIFEDPPVESRKVNHGPLLYEKVVQLFSDFSNITVIKGDVCKTLEGNLPDKIAFAQIDLNCFEPEMYALEKIYDRVSVGGMIVLDDYGFSRYDESYEQEYEFFKERGEFVLESPTGQGVFIKRG